MAYAEKTDIEVSKSVAEIITLVKKAGAGRILQFEEPERLVIQFEIADRLIRFAVSFPDIATVPHFDGNRRSLSTAQRQDKLRQRHRQRARALLLVIKAKLESVESQVETFEQAFLANIVMADGATVYERIGAPIALEYERGAPSALLLPPPNPQPRMSND